MSFAEHAIMWHVYPLGATGAPIRSAEPHQLEHRLPLLIPWLDYVVELGCNVVLLGPVFDSRTHGYDTADYFQVDPRLGDDSDTDEFISAAHRRGISIIFDGVFNHVAKDSQYQALTKDSFFEGHDGLVELDHTKNEVVELVVKVMNFWLDRGISGWRLDAVYATDPTFWQRVLPEVRRKHPHVWIFGEMIHGDYASYLDTAGLDSITQYELWKAIWSSLQDDNLFELQWTLERHNQLLDSFNPQTFIGNHDVTRIATRVGIEKAILAAVILFTVGGAPSIYYGDEQGFLGVKEDRIGGDDAIRPPLPLSPDDLLPDGRWIYRIYQELIALRRNNPWLHNARTTVEKIENKVITYRVDGDVGQSLQVHLTSSPSAVTVANAAGKVLFSFPR